MPPEEIPREDIAKIVERFIDQPRTQDAIVEFCNLNKIELIPTVEQLEDYEYQWKHDIIVKALFKEILAELQNLEYIPEFGSKSERQKIRERNDNIRVNIVRLFENRSVEYKLVTTIANELGGMTKSIIEQAGQTAFNKAMEVIMHITKEKFGSDLNLKHVRDYTIEIMEKGTGTKFDEKEAFGNTLTEENKVVE